MKPVRVMTIFGTRPEAIKMAPLVAELQGRTTMEALCCVSGLACSSTPSMPKRHLVVMVDKVCRGSMMFKSKSGLSEHHRRGVHHRKHGH